MGSSKTYVCSQCGSRKEAMRKPLKCSACGHIEMYKECEHIDKVFKRNGLI